MRNYRWVAVWGLLVLGISSMVRADEAPRVITESLCTIIQKKKISRSASAVVFGEPLEVGAVSKGWALPLKSISIPIPPGSYPVHSTKAATTPSNTFKVTLKRSDGLTIQISLTPMPVITDVFAYAEVAYKHKPGEGISRTSTLYGNPPTLMDLENDEYTYKRSDLVCGDPDTLKIERATVALVLKSNSAWDPSTLHVVGGKSAEPFWGLTRYGVYGTHWTFERQLPLDGVLVQVRYSAPHRDLIDEVYKGAWVMTSPPDPKAPSWLAQTAALMLDWTQHAVPGSATAH